MIIIKISIIQIRHTDDFPSTGTRLVTPNVAISANDHNMTISCPIVMIPYYCNDTTSSQYSTCYNTTHYYRLLLTMKI